MYNMENKARVSSLIQNYLTQVYEIDVFLNPEDLEEFFDLAFDPESGRASAIKYLRNLPRKEPLPWNPSKYQNNYFEIFVHESGVGPAQTQALAMIIGLREAKNIVDWVIAQRDWLLI